ncbi:MAG: hypothetical protein ACLR4Z_09775 [Butyricicoccaceae bacterium]
MVIADRTQDKTAVQYWKYSIRSDYSTQLTQDTIAYRRLTPPEHPQNNDIAAYEVWSSTLSGCSEAAGDAMLHRISERFSSAVTAAGWVTPAEICACMTIRFATVMWNITWKR